MMTLICGIPNAGKTTYSSRYQNVVHTDDVLPVNRSYTAAICEIVQRYEDVCVEGILCTARERRAIGASYNHGRKVCIWLDIPLDVCIARENRNRGEIIIKNCYALFEPPTIAEGWDEIIIIRGENDVERYSRQTEN